MAGKVIVLLLFTIGILYADAEDYEDNSRGSHIGQLDPEYLSLLKLHHTLDEYFTKMQVFHQELASSIAEMHKRYGKEMASDSYEDGYENAYTYAKPDCKSPYPPDMDGFYLQIAQPRPLNRRSLRREYYGLSSSSSGRISNINGKVNKAAHAQTTMNDNGKITTYHVGHP